MSKDSVLILGADNFIGQRIYRSLDSSDWAKPIFANPTSGNLPETNVIVNATTGNGKTIRNTARKLYETVAKLPTKPRVIHISSMTVYGSAIGIIDEQSPLLGDVSSYASAHVDAESIARAYAHSVIFRPGCEYGPECVQWSERIGRWLLDRRIGDLGPAGDGYCNLVYLDDLVSAVTKAAKLDYIEGESFNLCMPNPPTWNEYLSNYAKALGAVPVRRVTKRRLKLETKLLAIPLKLTELVSKHIGLSKPILPEAIPPSFLSLTRQEIILDARKAVRLLGMEWTTLAEGLSLSAKSLLRQ